MILCTAIVPVIQSASFLTKKTVSFFEIVQNLTIIPTTLIAYSILYYEFGLHGQICFDALPKCVPTNLHDGPTSIYFSVITLTTIGYGDFVPANASARIVAACEALSGYIIMAFLITSVARYLQQQRG